MVDLAHLTWPEAEAHFAPGTIAILPLGTIEPHGPHLPLDTDVTIARGMARRASERLTELSVRTLVLPVVPFGVTDYTRGFPGRLSLMPSTLWGIVEDLISTLEEQGIEHIVLANAHLEPAQVEVLRGVILDHAEHAPRKAHAIFADVTRRKFAARLGSEFQSGDCHAGRYETSLVLAEDPKSVRATRELAPVSINLIDKMKAGVRTFRDAGALDAYCGDPAAASAAEGHDLVERLAQIVVDAAREAWPQLFDRASDVPGRSRGV